MIISNLNWKKKKTQKKEFQYLFKSKKTSCKK
jgi:hypothetical protein